MHAALQQALQQLSLRTDEVQGLRKELEAAQAAAAGGGAAAAAADAGSLSAPLTPEVPAATEAVPAPASTVAASSAQGSGPASPASAAVGEAAGSDGGHAAGSPRAGGDAAAAGAAARHEPSALLYELQDARHQIKHLKGQVRCTARNAWCSITRVCKCRQESHGGVAPLSTFGPTHHPSCLPSLYSCWAGGAAAAAPGGRCGG